MVVNSENAEKGVDPHMMVCNDALAIGIKPAYHDSCCHHCVRSKGFVATKRCTGCRFVRYCGPECQKTDWVRGHKLECKFLKQGTEEDPDVRTLETRWQERMNGETNCALSTLVFRLYLQSKHELLVAKRGKRTGRRWSDLETHDIDIRKNPEKMMFYHAIADFISVDLNQRLDMPAQQELFQIFAKVVINSHSIYNWDAKGQCIQIGLALSLDISALDHSCRPNVDLFCKDATTYAIPLEPSLDIARDHKNAFISYTNLMSPRWARKLFLKDNYFFDCQCARCVDPEDDYLTAFLCENCQGHVPYPEDPYSKDSEAPIKCPKCQTDVDRKWLKKARSAMATLRMYTGTGLEAVNEKDEDYLDKQAYLHSLPPQGKIKLLQELKQSTDDILPDDNVYRAILFYSIITSGEVSARVIAALTSSYYVTLAQAYPRKQARSLLTELFFICATLAQNDAKDHAKIVLSHIDQIAEPMLRIDQWCLVDDMIKRLKKYIIEGENISLD